MSSLLEKVAALEAERDVLRARVTKLLHYADHLASCAALKDTKDRAYGIDFEPQPCDCGLAALSVPSSVAAPQEET